MVSSYDFMMMMLNLTTTYTSVNLLLTLLFIYFEAYGNDRVRGRSSHSKSPAHPPYSGNSFSSYDSFQSKSAYGRTEGWDNERRGSDLQSSRQFEYPAFPQSLEELEMEYKREATELGKICDKEEDEENYKHREVWISYQCNHSSNGTWCIFPFFYVEIPCVPNLDIFTR